jgi:hypothetical protein
MRHVFFLFLAVAPLKLTAASNSWSLASPDSRCSITVVLGQHGDLKYQVFYLGKAVLLPSPLGLVRDDQAFDRGLLLEQADRPRLRREEYELFAGTAPRVNHTLNHRSLIFRNGNGARLWLDLAASNEGVAFRYRFPDGTTGVHVVESELTGFVLPLQARGWLQPYHAASRYTPAYEDFYFHVSPGELPPNSREKALGWGFPALFHVPHAAVWLLLTESGPDASYCGTHLGPDSSGGLYHIAFPAADECTRGQTNDFGPEPRSTLPWTMPWRVLVVGKTAADIATATLVTDVAPPSRIKDTSWIKPGRASWSWWAYPDGPHTAERFNQFSDFAARMGWEYTLFDAGWWQAGLPNIAQHALSKGVAPLAWNFAGDFYSPAKRKKKLAELQAAGIQGVKVDFWCSDRQESIAAMQTLFEDAASRQLTVNLHGCTVPRGWQRTWPNFLSAEAVLGTESYMFESRYTEKAAELNTVLPFTRNAIGPMDITPVACSPKKFARTTTAAHELAAAIIFTSGLIHYADKPQFFDSLPPQATQILRDAPARWDETRCLMGEPGRLVVMARRTNKTWLIAGINGTTEQVPVHLDLAAFRKLHRRTLISEAENSHMQVAASPVLKYEDFSHQLPPRGGFILRMDE